MCSFLLSMQVSRFNEELDNAEGTVRVVRRRLTVEEVNTLLLETEYDGNTSERPVSSSLVAAASHAEDSYDGDSFTPDDVATPSLASSFFLMTHHGDCSICLDDYVQGDKIRSLPCGHFFHSACITKWLTERSCTCPLCKAILAGNEDDDDSDSLASSGDIVELREGGTQTDNGDEDATSTARAMYQSLVNTFHRSRRRNSRWWRRWQSRPLFQQQQQSPDIDETAAAQQQQPLLEHEMIETEEAAPPAAP